jgi:hypothetical protein
MLKQTRQISAWAPLKQIDATSICQSEAKKGSSSFLKKRTKKLLPVQGSFMSHDWSAGWRQQSKVFCFFFSKKKPSFLTFRAR